MTIGPREVVRSESGELAGPAHPIPEKTLDCGCSQVGCPKLIKFATRRTFVSLLSWLGLLQGTAHAYLYVTSPTIARRFQIDPHWMGWILAVSDVTTFLFGLIVAYWGDRIHRATWLGGLTFAQCVGYFLLMMPHWDSNIRTIEETENVPHMSLHIEESPELCVTASSRLVFENDHLNLGMLALLIFSQILTGLSNIGYYALGISYLDDNSKKVHVAAHIGIIVAIRIIGSLFGYILGWICLRIDSSELKFIESYQEQIGAWWLGWPVLAALLIMPATFLSWFPRRLPSVVVEQAAASILNGVDGIARNTRTSFYKVGSTHFFPSILRLITNKILVCNVSAGVFCAMGIVNFIANEDIFLESRFYVPRPIGTLLGFNDPLTSRLIINTMKPLVAGSVAIISGLSIARIKPKARTLVIYSISMIALTALIILFIGFITCKKNEILGEKRSGLYHLKRHCNYQCQCSHVFRPVCDESGRHTFYSPCHAGCVYGDHANNQKFYSGCSCLQTIELSNRALDGPCGYSDCQFGWLLFEICTLVAYSLLASIIVGDVLLNLRTVYIQDKALSIGFWMSMVATFVHLPGKIIYQKITDSTCIYWGSDSPICHLHHSRNLGDYLSYITASFLVISALIKCFVWWFSRDLRIYDASENEQPASRLEEIHSAQREPLLTQEASSMEQRDSPAEPEKQPGSSGISREPEQDFKPEDLLPRLVENDRQKSNGPIEQRTEGHDDHQTPPNSENNKHPDFEQANYDTDNELDSSSDDGSSILKKASPKVAYKPLDPDSDLESEGYLPKAQAKVHKVLPGNRQFPNPDHYEDPRRSKTKISPPEQPFRKTGDFNEVGLPITDPYDTETRGSRISMKFLEDVMIPPTDEDRMNRERMKNERTLVESVREAESRQDSTPELSPVLRPPSRSQASSGFGSLPDVRDRTSPQPVETDSSRKGTPSYKSPETHSSQPFICTDL